MASAEVKIEIAVLPGLSAVLAVLQVIAWMVPSASARIRLAATGVTSPNA